jgi:hypothetical protein
MAAKRPALPPILKGAATSVPLPELVRFVVDFSGSVWRYLAGLEEFIDSIGGSNAGARLVVCGASTLNFGTFPGTEEASVAVTAQTGIVATSSVNAWLTPVATADHSADEHRIESIKVRAGSIVAGTGFTVFGLNDNPTIAGEHSRIYGLWSVRWEWA